MLKGKFYPQTCRSSPLSEKHFSITYLRWGKVVKDTKASVLMFMR